MKIFFFLVATIVSNKFGILFCKGFLNISIETKYILMCDYTCIVDFIFATIYEPFSVSAYFVNNENFLLKILYIKVKIN